MKGGYVISLSSVPPRFGRLRPVLEALLRQNPAPERVLLCVAERYERFPGPVRLPEMPEGVELVRGEDIGPGMKALAAARHLPGGRLIYCDDDWIAGPGWAAALLAAGDARTAVTGQGFGVERLGRSGAAGPGVVDIAQGFSGVSVRPEWLGDATPPDRAGERAADDIWLSAHLAARGIAIREAPEARAALHLAYEADGLQQARIAGMTRAEANQACADWAARRYGVWPKTA